MRYKVSLFAVVVLLAVPAVAPAGSVPLAPEAAQAGSGQTQMWTVPRYTRPNGTTCWVSLSSRLGWINFHLFVGMSIDNCAAGWNISGGVQASTDACFSHNTRSADEVISWFTLCRGPAWYSSTATIGATLPEGYRFNLSPGTHQLGTHRFVWISDDRRHAQATHWQGICACS